MKTWESLAFNNETERRQYYQNLRLPPGHSVAAFWQDPVFKREMIERAKTPLGGRLLLISEANERCGLSALARAAVGETGTLVECDIIEQGRTLHEWNIYERLCRQHDAESFDAAIATTTHHMQELEREARELVRVVKPGGWVVFSDNGPGKLFFELAKLDVHLEFAAELLIHAMAEWLHFGDTVDTAYENIKRWGTKYDDDDVARAVRPFLEEINTFAWKGLWLVAGRKPAA